MENRFLYLPSEGICLDLNKLSFITHQGVNAYVAIFSGTPIAMNITGEVMDKIIEILQPQTAEFASKPTVAVIKS